MSISNKNFSAKDDLKANLSLSKSKMSYQEKEIECTLSLIKKFQTIVDHNKRALNSCLMDRNFLIEERCYLRSLITACTDNGFNDDDEQHIGEYMKKDSTSKLPKMSLFSEVYEILKAPKSEEFYKLVISRLSECYPCRELFYPNQTLIPNELKISTTARKMILYRIGNVGEYPLNGIIGRPVAMSLDVHISSGSGEILSIRGEEPNTEYHVTTTEPKMSYFILKSQTVDTRFVLLANTVPMLLAIEIQEPPDIRPEVRPSGYTIVPPPNLSEHQISFIKRDMTLKELRNRLLFLDAFFGENVHGCFVPLRLAVLDYHGSVLIDNLMCPRSQIRNYCTDQHGISEKEVTGAPDSQDTMTNFQRIIWDKVLVGHDLIKKLPHLRVDMRHICGVRELQGSYALKRLMQSRTDSWSLKSVLDRVTKNQIQKMSYSADYTAHIIRNIYIAVESHWRDSVDQRSFLSEPVTTLDDKLSRQMPLLGSTSGTAASAYEVDFFGLKK